MPISEEWVAGGNVSATANASDILDADLVCLKTQIQDPRPFSEFQDIAEDITGIFATRSVGLCISILLDEFVNILERQQLNKQHLHRLGMSVMFDSWA